MSQDVDRQKVLQTTKVRTSFKDDLSWIHKAKSATEEGSNESGEPAEEAKTPSLRQLSYVLLTAKKFEPDTSTDNGLTNGNSELVPPEPTNDTPTVASSTGEKNDLGQSKSNEQHSEESAGVSTNVKVNDVATTSAQIGTQANNDVSEVSADHTAEESPVNGFSTDTESTNVTSLLKAEGPLAQQPKEEAGVSVLPDILAESVFKSPSPQENNDGCSEAKALDILSDSLVASLLNLESKNTEINPVSDLLADQSTSEPAAEFVATKETMAEDTEVATGQAADKTKADTSDHTSKKEDAIESESANADHTVVQNSVASNGERTERGATEEVLFQTKGEEVCVDETSINQETKSEEATESTVAESATEAVCDEPTPACTKEEIAAGLSENTETTAEATKTPEESNEPKEEQCTVNETPVTNPDAKSESGEDPMSADTPSVNLEENVKDNIKESVESVVQPTSKSTDQTPAQQETDPDETFKAVPAVVSSSDIPEPNVEENNTTINGVLVAETTGAEAIVEPSSEVPAVVSVNHAALELDDALEPTPTGEQSKGEAGAVELTDALDESGKESEESKDSSVDQKSIDNDNSAQSLAEKKELSSTSYIMRDGQEVCSCCDQFIGLIKLILTYPEMYLHPDCLKCGMCKKILGDLLSPMFEHEQLIYCNSCYDKVCNLD